MFEEDYHENIFSFFFYFDSWLWLNFFFFFEKLYVMKKKFGAVYLYKVVENAQKHI